MILVLTGYMGSGKSSIGKELAASLNYNFTDLDDQIESAENQTISQIFSTKGEIYFRKKENQVLKELVNTSDKVVIATGGGTPCYGDTMEFLNSHAKVTTIFLKTSVAVLTHRLFAEKSARPLIAHMEDERQLTDFIRKHLFERSFYYSQSDLIVDIHDASIENIVEKIIVRLF
jgi:shikimate kinase